jgi:hypothetical protein
MLGAEVIEVSWKEGGGKPKMSSCRNTCWIPADWNWRRIKIPVQ